MDDRILDKLDRIEEQSRETLVAIARLQEQIKNVSDHEDRIRSLERWKWGLTGVMGLVATSLTAWTSMKGGT